MKPAYTLSLFSERTDLGPRPTSIALSAILHVVGIGVILFGVAYRPPVARISTDHYRVRELDLDYPDEEARAAKPKIPYPTSSPASRAPASQGKPTQSLAALRDVAQAQPGPQTILQPDVPKPITLPMPIPVPQVAIWAPSKVVVKKVTPPQPQIPTSSPVQPSVETPNEELTLADVNVASTLHPISKPIVNASTTSPVRVQTQQQVQLPPAMSTKSITRATPATILSLSNLRMKEGSATLPPVNESVVVVRGPGVLGAQGKDASNGNQNSNDKPGQGGTSPGPPGNPHNQNPGPGQGLAFKISGPGLDAPNGRESLESESGNGSDQLDNPQLSTTNITTPRDGKFASVAIGNTMQDRYPETDGVWNGRMAYTVYLHVGLAHSWVLQYSLPRSDVPPPGGSVLEAPWPYNIVRPNLDPESVDADAVMIHGFVNQSGHFETLSIVFPQAFPQAQFVLAALQKWQFRPAMQQGQTAKVEVLLIIPEQFE